MSENHRSTDESSSHWSYSNHLLDELDTWFFDGVHHTDDHQRVTLPTNEMEPSHTQNTQLHETQGTTAPTDHHPLQLANHDITSLPETSGSRHHLLSSTPLSKSSCHQPIAEAPSMHQQSSNRNIMNDQVVKAEKRVTPLHAVQTPNTYQFNIEHEETELMHSLQSEAWNWTENSIRTTPASLNHLPQTEIPPTFDASLLNDIQTLYQPEDVKNIVGLGEREHLTSSTREKKIRVYELERQLKWLQMELEELVYRQEINLMKITQRKKECLVVDKISSLLPASKVSMSLFTDDRGFACPSTPEGLQKAADKIQLPLYRKKYDWNLPLSSEQDRKRLLKLMASKIQNDVCKLIVEEKLYNGTIKYSNVKLALMQARDSLDAIAGELTDKKGNVLCEALSKRMDFLNEHLDLKLERVKISKPVNSDYHELIELPTSTEILDTDKVKLPEPLMINAIILKKYWIDFWDSLALAMSSKIEWSGRDCHVQWLHHLSSKVNRTQFIKNEDIQLEELALKYNGRHWDKIAKELNTGRTAYQCFERYQRRLNKELIHGEWSMEEDMALIAVVEEIGHEITGPSRWTRIAQRLPGRSNFQCRARYLHALKSDLRHGAWTPHEDICLQLLVRAYGRGKWTKISRHMPWRTDQRCRERYEHVLYPASKNEWTESDNSKLMSAVNKLGTTNWEAIATQVPGGRTAKQCGKQYHRLFPLKSSLDISRSEDESTQQGSNGCRTVLQPNAMDVACMAQLIGIMKQAFEQQQEAPQQQNLKTIAESDFIQNSARPTVQNNFELLTASLLNSHLAPLGASPFIQGIPVLAPDPVSSSLPSFPQIASSVPPAIESASSQSSVTSTSDYQASVTSFFSGTDVPSSLPAAYPQPVVDLPSSLSVPSAESQPSAGTHMSNLNFETSTSPLLSVFHPNQLNFSQEISNALNCSSPSSLLLATQTTSHPYITDRAKRSRLVMEKNNASEGSSQNHPPLGSPHHDSNQRDHKRARSI